MLILNRLVQDGCAAGVPGRNRDVPVETAGMQGAHTTAEDWPLQTSSENAQRFRGKEEGRDCGMANTGKDSM